MIDPQFRAEALQAYRAFNDSVVQQRLKQEAPVQVGVVYWNQGHNTADEIRYELTRMKEAGFTFVRFHGIAPRELADGSYDCTATDLRFQIAEEVGLLIFAHAHLHKPSTFHLKEAGLTEDEADSLGLDDERVAAAVQSRMAFILNRYKDHPALGGWTMSVEHPAEGIPLQDDADRARFKNWLQDQYPSPADIHQAWAITPAVPEWQKQGKAELLLVQDWDDAVALADRIRLQQPGARLSIAGMSFKEMYGVNRDLVRYRADCTKDTQRRTMAMIKAIDPQTVVSYGNHQMMYSNGQLGWDQHGCGRITDMHSTSIHPSWHFEPVQGELERPHYMQARLTSDVAKGAYTNCYETAGGPVQYSGGYGHHMDADLMRKLMLNFLAAGNEGSAFWSWQPRQGGMEAGEYGMLSLSGEVTPWALEAGAIARAMAKHRREIWHWDVDTELGIVRSWDTETVMAGEPPRHDLKDGPTVFSNGPAQQHVRGWIGAARAAINEQVDFQFLTTEEIEAGLSGVYEAIYLPHVRCLSEETLAALTAFVEAGGRLIADVQIGFEDQWGKLRKNAQDSLLARCFGGWIDNIHEATYRPLRVDDIEVDGFYGDLTLAGAEVIRRFDNGVPAVIEHQVGKGTATLVAFDAARMCWNANHGTRVEGFLADLYRGPQARRYSCDIQTTYRRRHVDADHYFIVNDGPSRSVVLRAYDQQYSQVEDVISGEIKVCTGTIGVEVPAYGGVWLRCARV